MTSSSTPPAATGRPAQVGRGARFAELHRQAAAGGPPLVLPTAWDAASAAVMADAGAVAVGTTSGGCAWSRGYPDGEAMPVADVVATVSRVTSVVGVPVSVDVEAGYAADPAGVARTVTDVVAAGAVGVNVEDGRHRSSGGRYPPDEAAERLRAARGAADASGVPVVLNARIDTFLAGDARDEEALLSDVVDRARRYADAGADVVFVPGLVDPALVRRVADGVRVPLGVMAVPGGPTVGDLHVAGAVRISLGTAVAQAAYGLARAATVELLGTGTTAALADAEGYASLNRLLDAGATGA